MVPMIHSNDLCTYAPVNSPDEVNVGDVVFCQVFPKGLYYAHLVMTKEDRKGGWYFLICNMAQVVNGWTHMGASFGKLVEVCH